MSGVIDDTGQWEHCNACAVFVLIQHLHYEEPSPAFPHGRDLCASCAAGNPPKTRCQVCGVKYTERASTPKCKSRTSSLLDPADYEVVGDPEFKEVAPGIKVGPTMRAKPDAKPWVVDFHVWVKPGLRREFFRRR